MFRDTSVSTGSSYQRAVLYVLPQQPVIIQGVFGFPSDGINWPLVYLVLYSPEKHVKGFSCRILQKQHRGYKETLIYKKQTITEKPGIKSVCSECLQFQFLHCICKVDKPLHLCAKTSTAGY